MSACRSIYVTESIACTQWRMQGLFTLPKIHKNTQKTKLQKPNYINIVLNRLFAYKTVLIFLFIFS